MNGCIATFGLPDVELACSGSTLSHFKLAKARYTQAMNIADKIMVLSRNPYRLLLAALINASVFTATTGRAE